MGGGGGGGGGDVLGFDRKRFRVAAPYAAESLCQIINIYVIYQLYIYIYISSSLYHQGAFMMTENLQGWHQCKNK